MKYNEISAIIIDTAVKLHTDLGPGLYEVVYEAALTHLLHKRGLQCQRQVPIRFIYDGITFDEGFKADIIVNNKILLELKSTESMHAAHRKQLQTYLRLTGLKLGILLNFGQSYMKEGIVRAVNHLDEANE
ncbi:MAG: GxxExxY protein [Akkermansiaceae bacterium]